MLMALAVCAVGIRAVCCAAAAAPAPAVAVCTGPQKKEDECIPDKLFMALCLSLCVNTLVLGLHQVTCLAR
jgi:hypothetical protein